MEQNTIDENEVMNHLTRLIVENSETCVKQFKERSGDKLDFSVKSLEIIDSILDEAAEFYKEITEENVNWIVNVVGAYIFEVARKNYGGKYFWYEKRKQPILVTGQPKFEISIVVLDKVKGRIENGMEDNIPFFFKGYSERVENAKDGDKVTIV